MFHIFLHVMKITCAYSFFLPDKGLRKHAAPFSFFFKYIRIKTKFVFKCLLSIKPFYMEIFFYRIDNIKINKEILLPDIDFLSAIVDALYES